MGHIMHDLETLGLVPGSVIRSIGAVVFDPVTGIQGAEFCRNIDQASCEALGLRADPGTEEWWAKQSPLARAALEVDQVPLMQALVEFTVYYETHGGRLWAQGPSFDPILLAAAYEAAGMKPPWAYNDPRDTRTVYEMAGITPDPTRASLHNALADAKAQAALVHEGYVRLGLSRTVDPAFDGRGAPIRFYAVRDDDWPVQWRLPEGMEPEEGLFDKMAWLTDDLVLRSAVNVWDNSMRIPGEAFEGISAGILSAHARFCSPAVINDLEQAADRVREGWLGMARQAQAMALNPPEAPRQCRHCGCTHHRPCETPEGPCGWVAWNVCSAAPCVAKEDGGEVNP